MTDAEQLAAVRRLEHSLEEVEELALKCWNDKTTTGEDEAQYDRLLRESQALYGRVKPLVGAPVYQVAGRSFDGFQHILSIPSLSNLQNDQTFAWLWQQCMSGVLSSVRQTLGAAEGAVQRIGAPVLRETLASSSHHTGDDDLDRLLTVAVQKFSNPDPAMRAEALEKLWDAFERMKTLLPGDKKQSAKQLLDQAVAEPNLRAVIEAETKALTDIGNNFMIRHTETNKTKIAQPEQVEYLFHRMFAFVYLILKATGRASV